MASAEAKASTPENAQEVLALVIDHETSAEVSRINKEIGRSVCRGSFSERCRVSRFDRLLKEHEMVSALEGTDAGYTRLLKEYVELKLSLHVLRRAMYWRNDPYYERDDINVSAMLERCSELRHQIKHFRRSVINAAWGGMEPERRTAYDKPLLHAMDEHTCSFVSEDGDAPCLLSAGHWYHGKPLCRAHLGKARRRARAEHRAGRKSFS